MGRREVDSEKAVVLGLEVVTGAAEEGGGTTGRGSGGRA